MRKLLLLLVLHLVLAVSVNADVIGYEPFDYADGGINGQSGGTGWDHNWSLGTHTGYPSVWHHNAGISNVSGNQLVIEDAVPSDGYIEVLRQFEADEFTGAFQGSGVIYLAATLTIDADQAWLGISAMDWGTERVKFGMPANGGGVMDYLGISNPSTGVAVRSNILATVGTTYRIVGVIDYDNDAARMWIDPDQYDYDLAWDKTSADVVFNTLDMTNWTSSVRLGSDLQTTWDDVIVATTFEETFIPAEILNSPHAPDPAIDEGGVLVDGLTVSWDVARNPANSSVADPDLLSHELYMSTPTDPNLVYVDSISGWDGTTLRAQHTLSSSLSRDSQYFWRVKEIRTSGNLDGFIWRFDTEKSIPIIDEQAGYQVVDATTMANFTITVSSISPASYQWYKVDDAGDIALSDTDADISGATTASLSIANVEIADEGAYYCIVNNQSGVPVASDNAMLGVKRKIANWSFELGSSESDVAGSPGTEVYGDPTFVAGNVGDGMSFDGDDVLYIDPNLVSYFDVCNYTMTVSCWIQSSGVADWSPIVSRNGDSGEGWQFRQNGFTADRISLTTRGTGNEEGSSSDRTIFDGNWHYAAATYDGAEKKVYIDGVLSASDTVSGLINPTISPVAMAGRVADNAGNWVFQDFMTCVLDDVSVYNYAQDAGVIAQIYADVTQTDVCPEHPAYDLDGDCDVDLADLARLAQEWLMDNTVHPN